MSVKLLDCTLRDGGYHNAWDFAPDLIKDYLNAMEAISADFVEIGFRTLNNSGYKGGCAYSTDSFINSLNISRGLKIGVMVNADELLKHPEGVTSVLEKLFGPASDSPVTLVRLACHLHEIEAVLPGITWLKDRGYLAAINLMQIADRTEEEIMGVAKMANNYPVEALYFADSMGSLSPDHTSKIIKNLRTHWKGELGIHTHDNTSQGLANSMRAISEGVTWIDATVTGMGRGPGNTKTEYLIIEIEKYRDVKSNPSKLFAVVNKYFKPMQNQYGWGTNPFYFLAGKHGIHPTYVQEMMDDARYDEDDILAVIDHLKHEGGKKFNTTTLESARYFYNSKPKGTWKPSTLIEGKNVLILGTGPGVMKHHWALEEFIKLRKPFVVALNTEKSVAKDLIDIRTACHPLRLLADCSEYATLPQPLVTPASQLPEYIIRSLEKSNLYDFGIQIQDEIFEFNETYCTLPNSLVISYALSIATSGKASKILLAGFDGYGADDPRTMEMNALFKTYKCSEKALEILAVTPTKYKIPTTSIYAI